METKAVLAAIAIGVLCLILGAVVGEVYGSTEVVTETVTEFVNVSVEKLVEVEVPSADTSLIVLAAVDDFMSEVEDDDDLQECNGNSYDMDEISVIKVYDSYSISVEDDEQTVDFSVRLKYDEEDERSCRNTYDVSVFYEDDEDPEVEVH